MKRIRVAVMVLIAVAIISIGIWWLTKSASPVVYGDIETSGFIEAKDVAVALEAGGRIVEIATKEGDRVEVGATLVRLDDSLLKAQKQQAEANVQMAQAILEQAIAATNGAKIAWDRALDIQSKPLELDPKAITARGELDMAELNLKKVQADSDLAIALEETKRDTARKILDNLESYNALGLVSIYQMRKEIYPAEGERVAAELNLSYQREMANLWVTPAAKLRRDNAQRTLQSLLESNDFAVDQAYSVYQTASATMEAAQRQLEHAKASLLVINVQLSKLTIASPVAGVVAAKYAEVGEIAKPDAPILTITELDSVTLTAYVPESRIGLVKLGQKALVSVDSYPAESFSGEVVFISPQAQFTPRNVQLKEEREKTVFAVKIRLDNPDQKLKPGMPADARILTSSSG